MKQYKIPIMKTLKLVLGIAFLVLFVSCKQEDSSELSKQSETSNYFKSEESGIKTGGVKIITIDSPKGKLKVWTKRFGNNPKMKLLLLSGGPGISHEYFECMESFLPAEGIEIIYYDQTGTGLSDNPNDTAMWDLPR